MILHFVAFKKKVFKLLSLKIFLAIMVVLKKNLKKIPKVKAVSSLYG